MKLKREIVYESARHHFGTFACELDTGTSHRRHRSHRAHFISGVRPNTDTIASVAAKRHTEPKRLGTIVRGELDWIVMTALE
ncbi:MAG: hypothetical protein ACK46I_11385, partial [Phycisphaerae bacterium]